MDITEKAEQLRDKLKARKDSLDNPIDLHLPVIGSFNGGGKIRLIILGQDPTVKNVASRSHITKALNLDKNNAIRSYVNQICQALGISIDNIYATNIFKYFYTRPPATTMHVLYSHLSQNLTLLQEELSGFENLPMLSLGEPVLRLLTHPRGKVRKYWDYNLKTGETSGRFSYVKAQDNKLVRDFFPFPHQPSIRKVFYKENLPNYLSFMNMKINLEIPE